MKKFSKNIDKLLKAEAASDKEEWDHLIFSACEINHFNVLIYSNLTSFQP